MTAKLKPSKESEYMAIGKSNIGGTGVYATQDIKKGTRIIEYTGEKIPTKVGDDRSDEQLAKGLLYIFELNSRWDLDGLKGGDARLINHSCDPNCEAKNVGGRRIYIHSKRKIKEGDELTYDYGLTGDDKLECKCGSPKCKGEY